MPRLGRPVVRELSVDTEVLRPKMLDHLLQGVAILAADSNKVALDGGLHLLLGLLDRLHDLARLFDRDPVLQRDLLANSRSRSRFNRAESQSFQRHLTFHK